MSGAGCGACAHGSHPLRPGGAINADCASWSAGSPSGPTTWLCLQWLDADRMKAAKAGWIKDTRHPSGPGSTVPSPKIAASNQACADCVNLSASWSAARRCASFRRESETLHFRLAALHAPHCFEAKETNSATRAMRECNHARLSGSGCLKFESERRSEARSRITLNRRPHEGGDP